MNNDPFTFLFQLFSGGLGLLMLILWFVVIGRIGEIRDEAKRQTRLLEQIARNTSKPEDAVKTAVGHNYIREESKAGISWFLGIMAVILLALFFAALVGKK